MPTKIRLILRYCAMLSVFFLMTTDMESYAQQGTNGEQGLIVFFSSRESLDPREVDIFTMRQDGENVLNLTHGLGNAIDPTWSPDGTQIAFSALGEGNLDVYIMDVDGTNTRQLTNDPLHEVAPSWSPDGQQISFTATVSFASSEADIYIINTDGTGRRNVTASIGFDNESTWSPDGTEIAFSTNRDGNFEIYRLNLITTTVQNLTQHPGRDYSPSWARNGSLISFLSNRETRSNSARTAIYAMVPDGTQLVKLVEVSLLTGVQDWSLDSQSIIFDGCAIANPQIGLPTCGIGIAELGNLENLPVIPTFVDSTDSKDRAPSLQPVN